jgi:hypothetical protein
MNVESYSNHDTVATRMAARNTQIVLERQAQRKRQNRFLKRILIAAFITITVAGLYLTAPQHNLQECAGTDVPAHCVD